MQYKLNKGNYRLLPSLNKNFKDEVRALKKTLHNLELYISPEVFENLVKYKRLEHRKTDNPLFLKLAFSSNQIVELCKRYNDYSDIIEIIYEYVSVIDKVILDNNEEKLLEINRFLKYIDQNPVKEVIKYLDINNNKAAPYKKSKQKLFFKKAA